MTSELDPNETPEDRASRLRYFVFPCVEINIKVKPGGSLKYFTVCKDANFILTRRSVAELLCAVLAFTRETLKTRLHRTEKLSCGLPNGKPYPEAIMAHERRLVRQAKVNVSRLQSVVDYLADETEAQRP